MSPEEMGEAENSKKKKGQGMNGSKYVIQVLQGPLKSFVEELEGERSHSMLVEENRAPGHKSKLTKNAQSELRIKQLTHPPKSPDLNPIKPLWYLLRIGLQTFQGLQIPLINFGRQLRRCGRRSRQRRLKSSLGPCRTELRLSRRLMDGIQSIELAYYLKSMYIPRSTSTS
jgi:transposase